MNKKIIPYLFLLPSMAGCSIFLVVPYFDVLRRSFLRAGSSFVGMQNFIEVWNNEAFRLATKNTVQFTAVCIPLLLVLSFVIALYIYDHPRLGGFLRTGFLMPMAMPVASVVLVWRCLFDYQGILNGILDMTGSQPLNWMESETSFWILVGSYVWRNLGYHIILWLAALSALHPSAIEAARLDGANRLQCHLHITLPQMKSSMGIIGIIAVLNSFKVFREAYLVAGDYPHESMYLQQHLFTNWFRNLEMDKIAAASVMDSVVLIVLILILQRKWDRRESHEEPN